jgi:hypothetical protein
MLLVVTLSVSRQQRNASSHSTLVFASRAVLLQDRQQHTHETILTPVDIDSLLKWSARPRRQKAGLATLTEVSCDNAGNEVGPGCIDRCQLPIMCKCLLFCSVGLLLLAVERVNGQVRHRALSGLLESWSSLTPVCPSPSRHVLFLASVSVQYLLDSRHTTEYIKPASYICVLHGGQGYDGQVILVWHSVLSQTWCDLRACDECHGAGKCAGMVRLR